MRLFFGSHPERMACGATVENINKLLNHSSYAVTDRYIHGHLGRLEKVAVNVVLLKPSNKDEEHDVPKKFPRETEAV